MPENAIAGVQFNRCLNLGCGSRYRAGWTNVDMIASGQGVMAHDLTKGLPFDANAFDVVYHSHVLEHFPANAACAFLRECNRVLRDGGVIRVAVPDLERIARIYLDTLDAADSAGASVQDRHQWIVLEMYDQTVREAPGGGMARYLRKLPSGMREFVLSRLGVEASRLLAPLDGEELLVGKAPADRPNSCEMPHRSALRKIAGLVRHPRRIRELMIRSLLGSEYELLQLGRFRRGGEVHQWMYDRCSLGRLLMDAGFINARVCGPDESRIAGWSSFNLDTEPNGTTYKPDSLYMEANKP